MRIPCQCYSAKWLGLSLNICRNITYFGSSAQLCESGWPGSGILSKCQDEKCELVLISQECTRIEDKFAQGRVLFACLSQFVAVDLIVGKSGNEIH